MQTITTNMSVDELLNSIRNAVRTEFEQSQHQHAHTDEILTRKETAYRLKCDISTLWRRRKKLVPRKRDGSVFYYASEVEAYLNSYDNQ